jgi:hypothetical protein
MDPLYVPSSIRTFSGNYVNVFNPDLNTLVIEDIAHALSMQCRYGGHAPMFYSVATHCIWMVHTMMAQNQRAIDVGAYNVPMYTNAELYAALMHDSSEAYLVDIPKPIKNQLKEYNYVEDVLMHHLAAKFKFEYPLPTVVKEWDVNALEWEWENLICNKVMATWPKAVSHKWAKREFLRLYKKLKPKEVKNKKGEQ